MSTPERELIRQIVREELGRLQSPRSGVRLPAGWEAQETERPGGPGRTPQLVEILRSSDGTRIVETTLRRSTRRGA